MGAIDRRLEGLDYDAARGRRRDETRGIARAAASTNRERGACRSGRARVPPCPPRVRAPSRRGKRARVVPREAFPPGSGSSVAVAVGAHVSRPSSDFEKVTPPRGSLSTRGSLRRGAREVSREHNRLSSWRACLMDSSPCSRCASRPRSRARAPSEKQDADAQIQRKTTTDRRSPSSPSFASFPSTGRAQAHVRPRRGGDQERRSVQAALEDHAHLPRP